MSDSANWEKLQDLFHLVESTPVADRERVLTDACADPGLRRRVVAILQAAEQESEDLNSGESSHPVFGPYRLIRLIGAGGIGAVYLAERLAGDIVQRSALKVLAPHAGGAEWVSRFHRETHILASLDHPHITRMQDAGLSDAGQPYLVMEYVDGTHIDDFSDEHRLTIEPRLKLFLDVCDAVAYAHRNLIVHLDLKPSNILVNSEGAVKLLDFGTAKLIDLDGRFTSTRLATPAYASPEQMRGEPVTTLCDVYSLGAVLFELLAGQRPSHDSSAAAVLDRAIREQEPERLESGASAEAAAARGLTTSRLRQRLAGDLSTIVAKCLRPRAKDRYVTVNALVADISRHLEGRPVLARRQTAIYRAGKFLRRNWIPLAISTLVGIALAGTLGYATLRQRQAFEEGQRALRMQTFLYDLFKLANLTHTGKPAATVPEFLRLGVQVLPQYIKEPRDLREAELGLAESMYDNGDYSDALKPLNEVARSAQAAGDNAAQAEAETFAGDIAYKQGRSDEGAKLTDHALQLSMRKGVPPSVRVRSEIFFAVNRENYGFRDDRNVHLMEDAVEQSRVNRLSPEETGLALTFLGEDLENRGRMTEAFPILTDALAIYGSDPLAVCNRSEIYSFLGAIRHGMRDEEGSLRLHQQAHEGYVTCSGRESRDALSEQDYIAGQLIQLGRPAEAVPLLEAALPVWRRLVGENPELAPVLYYLSRAYVETGQWAKAAALAKEEVDVQTGKVQATDRRFGMGQWIWARALAGEHRYSDALPHAREADALLGRNAVSPTAKKLAGDVHALRLEIEAKAGAEK